MAGPQKSELKSDMGTENYFLSNNCNYAEFLVYNGKLGVVNCKGKLKGWFITLITYTYYTNQHEDNYVLGFLLMAALPFKLVNYSMWPSQPFYKLIGQ